MAAQSQTVDRLQVLAAELVRRQVAVIATAGGLGHGGRRAPRCAFGAGE
jgi:hypothetical protein